MLPYIVTIFLSAFLLFQVQPIIAKIILPWFGGSAAVWTTCLMFFQMALLLGYLYSHWSIQRLQPKAQTSVHLALLALSLLSLPILPREAMKPTGAEEPILKISLLLLLTVGLPYFLLSTTSSMLQAWYVRQSAVPIAGGKGKAVKTGHSPYRLYAISNAGSLLALLSYPVVVEPVFPTKLQAYLWSGTYALFALLCARVAWKARNAAPIADTLSSDAEAGLPVGETEAEVKTPSMGMHLLWMSLVACSTILLLSITTHLTQNIAPVPLLWVLPLSLYLFSFILTFGARRWEWQPYWLFLPPLAFIGMVLGFTSQFQLMEAEYLLPTFLGGLFICCMICHGELARTRPHPKHLTSYYLMISLGGAMGGLFVGFLAPTLFSDYYELPLGLGACALIAALRMYQPPKKREYRTIWLLGVGFALAYGIFLLQAMYLSTSDYKYNVRNFYGVLRVYGVINHTLKEQRWIMMHGNIEHGIQIVQPESRRREPTTYYGPYSGVGLALLETNRPLLVGVVGLGTGTLAAYSQPRDTYRFYEINPLVEKAARNDFTFLQDAPGKVEVVMGDARLSMEREPPQNYDVLALDAFSGDSIPVHLLTKEAFQLYFRHLKPGGVLAVHVSNRFLHLESVVERIASSLGKESRLVTSSGHSDKATNPADWVLVTDRKGYFDSETMKMAAKPIPSRPELRIWTDDYSNLFQIMK